MASPVTILLLVGPVVVFCLVIATIWVHRKSYKYKCFIAIPTGEAKNDVIFTPDTFKTRKKQGHTEILFYKNAGKVYAPNYKFWGKWSKRPINLAVGKAQTPSAENPYANYMVEDAPIKKAKKKDNWVTIDETDLRNALIRGAFFYKVSDQEYKVMRVNTDGDFTVLDSDSIQFVIDDIEDQKNLTTSFKDKLIALGTWLGSLLIIAILAVVIITLSLKYAGEQTTTIVEAARAAAASAANVGG